MFHFLLIVPLDSEEIHGEIFFVLYKLCILLRDKEEEYFSFDQKLLYLSLQALVKAQNDVVRTNCIGCNFFLICVRHY